MTNEGLLCWSCGKPTGIKGKVFRADTCVDCMAALRSCRGCKHFEPTRRFQCIESIEKSIPEKDKANFCDYFQMRDVIKVPGGISANTESKDSRKKNFDDLFND